MRWKVLVIAAVLGVVARVEARVDLESERESLRGLGGVQVLVEDVEGELGKYVWGSDLQTRIELRLRAAGIPLYGQSEWKQDARHPLLYVALGGFPQDKEIS